MGSDEGLIQRMKRGDDSAIEEFVRSYYPMIRAYCGKRLADPGLAEDLTQETFEHFFRNFSSYRHHGKVLNYLYTIAGNLCRDFYKTAGGEIPTGEADLDSGLSPDPLNGLEERLDLKRAVDRLPEIYRQAVVLHFFCGLKQREIAAMLNIRPHVVKYRLSKGKKLLRKLWKGGIL